MNLPLSIFELVCIFMGLVAGLGLAMGGWYFFRVIGKKETNLLFSFFLGVLSLSLLHNLLVNIGIFNSNARWYFIPIWYTLSFGPLLFFFTKSRLFAPFQLQKKDFKHFIIPVVQAAFYVAVGFRSAAFKSQIWDSIYLPLYKPLEGLIYVVGFSMYLYFAYRFIRYKLFILQKRKGFFWEFDKTLRLKRMVKGLILLFVISGASIIGDFLTYRFLGVNLNNIRGFTYIGDLSFALMVLWVTYYAFRNAFFPSRVRFEGFDNKEALITKVSNLLEKEKIYLDDELDSGKLSYYLRLSKKRLKRILPNDLGRMIDKHRIKEAKSRISDKKFQSYSLESIGLDVGFSSKSHFNNSFKKLENISPQAFNKNINA